ncbi:MAG: aldolase/citrate lyase family protein [Clostridia bacterium]|nr:aldolase/citrate lyase family protein [Clostridia bacterium]
MLKLMYITNRTDVARVAQAVGVDRIFVDMEYIGKDARQKGLDTVKSHHTVEDVKKLRQVLTSSELLVRVNPIHEASESYGSSEEEINAVIEAGADVIMLPYFKTVEEVKRFLGIVGGRVKTMLLMETPEAAALAEQIVKLPGIDEIHLGINDMSLGYGMKFMFDLLADGTVDRLCSIIRAAGIPYGFGGIAALGKGMLPSEHVICEHYRLGSSFAILSRSFCNTNLIPEIERIEPIFREGVGAIRAFEAECSLHPERYEENRRIVIEKVEAIRALNN